MNDCLFALHGKMPEITAMNQLRSVESRPTCVTAGVV